MAATAYEGKPSLWVPQKQLQDELQGQLTALWPACLQTLFCLLRKRMAPLALLLGGRAGSRLHVHLCQTPQGKRHPAQAGDTRVRAPCGQQVERPRSRGPGAAGGTGTRSRLQSGL